MLWPDFTVHDLLEVLLQNRPGTMYSGGKSVGMNVGFASAGVDAVAVKKVM